MALYPALYAGRPLGYVRANTAYEAILKARRANPDRIPADITVRNPDDGALDLDGVCKVSPGADGCRLWVTGIVMRNRMTASEAMTALQETRRLALCGSHDALSMLSETLARKGVDYEL